MRISQLTNSARMSGLYLNKATNNVTKSTKRLSSGKKLASDMVGELGKLNTLKSHRNSANAEISNLQSGQDYLNVKDGALSQISKLAEKISTAYSADTVDTDAVAAYTAEINSIIENTEYNGKKVFDKAAQTFGSASITASGLVKTADGKSDLDFSDATKTAESIAKISSEISKTGAYQNGLEARVSVTTEMVSALDESISRIEDVDVTDETLNLTKEQTLQQLALTMINNTMNNSQSLINYLT